MAFERRAAGREHLTGTKPRQEQISRWRREWRQDPFARGAHSFNAVATSGQDRQAHFGTDWDGRIMFSGEATCREHAVTVHGALMKGQKAVQGRLDSRPDGLD